MPLIHSKITGKDILVEQKVQIKSGSLHELQLQDLCLEMSKSVVRDRLNLSILRIHLTQMITKIENCSQYQVVKNPSILICKRIQL